MDISSTTKLQVELARSYPAGYYLQHVRVWISLGVVIFVFCSERIPWKAEITACIAAVLQVGTVHDVRRLFSIVSCGATKTGRKQQLQFNLILSCSHHVYRLAIFTDEPD
ncbi:uncharacterized protein YALI1_E04107g [Yarrowia lipolytica]|uniref:Uncharacterized protein n=1 Tax=Yarrowia lipolytica TaxID=4952 RepID=A0A1D8NGZ1_YARLL|nr:hypothetical protein YALI1_E04107g [Yarrowia lipolytica]